MKRLSLTSSSEPKHSINSTEYIEVLGEEVAVHKSPNLMVDGESCEGVFYLSRRAIYLEAGLPQDRMDRVFKHEVFHAYLGISGLSEYMGDIKLEEALCTLAEVM